MKRLSMFVVAALALLCGCHQDISGTYLVSDSGSVTWLQLVRTPDDHLTGQLSLSKLNTEGKIDFDSVAVAGAIGDGNLTLSGSRLLGLQTFTLSGTADGNKLTLSGSGEPTPFVMNRADMSEYQKQLAILNGRSQSILASKTAASSRLRTEQASRGFVLRVDQLIRNMGRFDSEANVHLARFPAVERGYQSITAKINEYVERERRLAGNPDAAIARSQLSIAASQASFATEQAHYQGQALQSSLEINGKPMVDEGTNLGAVCQRLKSSPDSSLTSKQIEAQNAACDRLADEFPTFSQRYNAMTAGLTHLEQIYTHEKSAQQELLHTAEQLR